MSTYTTDKASPFTRAVISSMRRLYESDAFLSRRAGHRLMDCQRTDIPRHWPIRASIILGVSLMVANGLGL